jgi:hypothetical protein
MSKRASLPNTPSTPAAGSTARNRAEAARTDAAPKAPAEPELAKVAQSNDTQRDAHAALFAGNPNERQKRKTFLQRVKDVLRMALGQDDDDDDYECNGR